MIVIKKWSKAFFARKCVARVIFQIISSFLASRFATISLRVTGLKKNVDSLFFFQAALNFGKFIFRESERESLFHGAREVEFTRPFSLCVYVKFKM